MAGKLKILLVEDNPGDARLLKEAVYEAGYDCIIEHVMNGRDALEYLDDWADTVDLVLTDLNMPKISGQELLRRMKENKQLRDIPVAVLTTSSHDTDRTFCRDHGAAIFMTKPVDLADYEDLIRRFFGTYLSTGVADAMLCSVKP